MCTLRRTLRPQTHRIKNEIEVIKEYTFRTATLQQEKNIRTNKYHIQVTTDILDGGKGKDNKTPHNTKTACIHNHAIVSLRKESTKLVTTRETYITI